MPPSDETGARRKPIRLIAAACRNMGIGRNGQLPWNLPTEFQFLLDTIATVSRSGRKNMLIWGRGSWSSCPESVFPIANCLHAVLSKSLRFVFECTSAKEQRNSVPRHAHYVCEDFPSAVHLATHALHDLVETIWVLGGSKVYEEALSHPWCDLLYLTDIMAEFDCDVFFPYFDRNVFRRQASFPGVPHSTQEENGVKFQFQVFKREDEPLPAVLNTNQLHQPVT